MQVSNLEQSGMNQEQNFISISGFPFQKFREKAISSKYSHDLNQKKGNIIVAIFLASWCVSLPKYGK